MASDVILKNSVKLISRSILILSLILCAPVINAQTLADFSGVWTKDDTKSDDFYKDFNITYTIIQTPQLFKLKQTFSDKNDKEITSNEFSFNLDEKEISKEVEGGINKESALWSTDKKTLTTKSTRTVGSDVYGSTASYSLSDNGLVLTVQISDIIPGGLSVKQVFNKKP